MIEKWCGLNGPLIRFRAPKEALLAPAIEGWALTQTDPEGLPDFTLDVAYAPFAEAPADAPLLFEGTAPPDLHCVIRQMGDYEHYAVDGRATLLLGERSGLLEVAPGEERLVRSSIAFQAINAALTLDDQLMLHAAALTPPESEAACLIFGPSGFGKTTTTLSLAAAGWHLLSDDISIIKPVAGTDRVWGLPLALKVHRKTASLLPWLAPLLSDAWDSRQEQPLAFAELCRFVGIAPTHHTPHPIAAIVVLAERSEHHRLRPLAKSDSFRAIVSDNVSRNLQGIGLRQQIRVGRITELLRNTPAYVLNAGPDLHSLSSVLLSALG